MAIIETIPLTKCQEKIRFDDGSAKFRCYSPSNPHYYTDSTGGLQPIELNYSENVTLPTIGDAKISRRNITSVGIRKDGDSSKFLGLRPDETQHLGTEQLEFTVNDIIFDSTSMPINLGSTDYVDAITTDLGSMLIRSNRQGSRQLIKATGIQSDFKIVYQLHLTGLTIQNETTEYDNETIRSSGSGLDEIKVTGTFYVPDENGNFKITNGSDREFVISRPKILDSNFNILTTVDSTTNISNIINGIHTLELKDGGVLEYIKYGTAECIDKYDMCSYIDADIYYGSTADGDIYHAAAIWANVRGAATGTTTTTNRTTYQNAVYAGLYTAYYMIRSLFYFDTSAVTGTVLSCEMGIYGISRGATSAVGVTCQLGTQADTLTNADYDAFSGSVYDTISTWNQTAYNVFTFSDQGCEDINTSGTSKICCRSVRDVNDQAPTYGSYYSEGMYYADNTGTDHDPYLEIVANSAYISSPSQRLCMFG